MLRMLKCWKYRIMLLFLSLLSTLGIALNQAFTSSVGMKGMFSLVFVLFCLSSFYFYSYLLNSNFVTDLGLTYEEIQVTSITRYGTLAIMKDIGRQTANQLLAIISHFVFRTTHNALRSWEMAIRPDAAAAQHCRCCSCDANFCVMMIMTQFCYDCMRPHNVPDGSCCCHHLLRLVVMVIRHFEI